MVARILNGDANNSVTNLGPQGQRGVSRGFNGSIFQSLFQLLDPASMRGGIMDPFADPQDNSQQNVLGGPGRRPWNPMHQILQLVIKAFTDLIQQLLQFMFPWNWGNRDILPMEPNDQPHILNTRGHESHCAIDGGPARDDQNWPINW